MLDEKLSILSSSNTLSTYPFAFVESIVQILSSSKSSLIIVISDLIVLILEEVNLESSLEVAFLLIDIK